MGPRECRLGRAVEEVLAAHIEVAVARFSGVRHGAAWDASRDVVNHQADPPAKLLLDPRFAHGVRVLGAIGLTYDAWIYRRQLTELVELVELARSVPETTIILDHLGA